VADLQPMLLAYVAGGELRLERTMSGLVIGQRFGYAGS
jgi:hypothetical protein